MGLFDFFKDLFTPKKTSVKSISSSVKSATNNSSSSGGGVKLVSNNNAIAKANKEAEEERKRKAEEAKREREKRAEELKAQQEAARLRLKQTQEETNLAITRASEKLTKQPTKQQQQQVIQSVKKQSEQQKAKTNTDKVTEVQNIVNQTKDNKDLNVMSNEQRTLQSFAPGTDIAKDYQQRQADAISQATKENPFATSLMGGIQEAQFGISPTTQARAYDEDVEIETNLAGDIIGRTLGYATSAGIAESAIANKIASTAIKNGTKKLPTVAKIAGTGALLGAPTNILTSVQEGGTAGEIAGNIAMNAALDTAVGALFAKGDINGAIKAAKNATGNTSTSSVKEGVEEIKEAVEAPKSNALSEEEQIIFNAMSEVPAQNRPEIIKQISEQENMPNLVKAMEESYMPTNVSAINESDAVSNINADTRTAEEIAKGFVEPIQATEATQAFKTTVPEQSKTSIDNFATQVKKQEESQVNAKDDLRNYYKTIEDDMSKGGFSEEKAVDNARAIATKIVNAKKSELDPIAKETLGVISGKKIKLSDIDRAELAYKYGSVKNAQNAVMPYVNLSRANDNAGSSYDVVVKELEEELGEGALGDSRSVTGLFDTVVNLKQKRTQNYAADPDELIENLTKQIYDRIGTFNKSNKVLNLEQKSAVKEMPTKTEAKAETKTEPKAKEKVKEAKATKEKKKLKQSRVERQRQASKEQIEKSELRAKVAKAKATEKARKKGDVQSEMDIIKPKKTEAAKIKSTPEQHKKIDKKTLKDEAMIKIADAGYGFEKFAKQNNSKIVSQKTEAVRKSSKIAQNIITKGMIDENYKIIGKSLEGIFEPIQKRGKDTLADFDEYMFHRLNIEREPRGKSVFGKTEDGDAIVTAQESVEIVKMLEEEYKDLFKTGAKDIAQYIQSLNDMRVKSGVWSKETREAMETLYENYIPTFRVKDDKVKAGKNYGSKNIGAKDKIKAATGSNLDLKPVDQQLAEMTKKVVTAKNVNDLFKTYAQELEKVTGAKIKEINLSNMKPEDKIDQLEKITMIEPNTDGTGNLIYYMDGVPYSVEVDKTMMLSSKELLALTQEQDELSQVLMNSLGKANNIFKALITSYNPAFLVKNIIRDVPEAIFNSTAGGGGTNFLKAMPKAIKSIAKKDEYWKLWESSGGLNSSYFDAAQGVNFRETWFKRKALDRIEALNQAVEQLPRMTEFIAVIDNELAGKAISNADKNMVEKASQAGSEVTVNFGKSGKWGRVANKTAVPFLNPSIQGLVKFTNRFVGKKEAKAWVDLAVRATVLGMAPAFINEGMYGDDPDYQNLNQRDKDTNFLIKMSDGVFIKIPRSRMLSVISMPAVNAKRNIEGQEVDWNEVMSTATGQVGAINPLESNFFSPLKAVYTNEAWYGAPIESESMMTTKAPSERYDENTSRLAISAGKVIDMLPGEYPEMLSPARLNYLLDAYTGVIGDFIIPGTNAKAENENGAIVGTLLGYGTKNFTVDAVSQNALSQKFYDRKEEIDTNAVHSNATVEDKVKKRYYNYKSSEISEISSQIKDIQNNNALTDKQKLEKTRELEKEQNAVFEQVKENEEVFVETYTNSVKKYSDIVGSDKAEDLAFETAKIETAEDGWEEVMKASVITNSENRQAYAETLKGYGVTPVEYRDMFIGVDTNNSGGSPSQEEAYNKLNTTNLTEEQKASVWNMYGKTWKTNPFAGGSVPSSSGSSKSSSGGSSGRSSGGGSSSGSSRKQTESEKAFASYAKNRNKGGKTTSTISDKALRNLIVKDIKFKKEG